jgi:hypothetical protein
MRRSVVCIVTRLKAGDRPGFESWLGQEDFSLLQNAHTGSEAHPVSYLVGTVVLSCGSSSRGLKLTTEPYILPRLRMSGTIPLHLPHAFTAWTGKMLLYFLYFRRKSKNDRSNSTKSAVKTITHVRLRLMFRFYLTAIIFNVVFPTVK